MISRRFAQALLVALAVALLPTLRHGYFGHLAAAPRVTEGSLPTAVQGALGSPRARTGGWMTSTYAADSWAERSYRPAGRGEVSLFVARGFDLKKLYHHPELFVSYGTSLRPAGVSVLPGTPPLPVTVLRSARGEGTELVIYALVSGDEVVANPYVYQGQAALRQLLRGRELLTLIYVHASDANPDGPIDAEPAARVLRDAVAGFLAQPPSPSS